jgi:excisionase family DNA binding protein
MAADLDSRAIEVAEAIGVMTQPVKIVSLRVWSMRKGWTFADLDAAVARAVEQGLLVSAAQGLTSAMTESEPATEEPEETSVESPTAPESPAQAPTILDCLCARTAPHKNYDCPEHGGARIKEDSDMGQHWISTAEAAELLGVTKRYAIKLVERKKIEAKQDGDGSRAPFLFRRTSVIAYRDARRKEQAERDLLPPTPAKRKAAAPRKSKALVPVAEAEPTPIEAAAVHPLPAELADVRALVRFVDKGWFSKDDAWAKLRDLVMGL